MKHILLSIAILFAGTILAENNAANFSELEQNSGSLNRSTQIDQSDSVIFDLSQSVINGNSVEFPVYIHSDDTINALDFSFRFNQVNFAYDTTVNLTSYLQVYSYYNTIDSTLRFTSNSLPTIGNDTPLVLLRFTSSVGQLCSGDLNSITVYLNGDPCSYKVITCISAGVMNLEHLSGEIEVYPNPTTDFITISSPETATLKITDINGSEIFRPTLLTKDISTQIQLQSLPNGVYLVKVFNEKFISIKRIVLNR
ncbi:MAG: T9SS type A sorting domain-containing protein [Bacteroidia bacterium]|nr:T9SS type A sorting domain-containing protein [Bacteroidia bacterium]